MQIYSGYIDHLDTRKEKRRVPSTIIKTSTIKGAGKGIFAGECIKKGDHLGWYYGNVHYTHPLNDSHYILCIEMKPCWVSQEQWNSRDKKEGLFIDANPHTLESDENMRDYRFSRLNHASHKKANVKFLSNGRVVAVKNIKHNEEMFVNYGNAFFES